MRPDQNNDIDLLLRQLSRRNVTPVSEINQQHLDADELNSYVANALPSAARARYTEHLADCSNCRKLVAQLSVAQGPVAAEQSGSVGSPSSLKSFLASLFSPMVLRYAAPALGLIVVAVVGFVVLRPERREATVAQLSQRDQSKPATADVPEQPSPASPTAHYSDSISEDRSETKKDAPQRGPVAPIAKDAPTTATKQPADAMGTVAEAPPPAPKPAVANEPPAGTADVQKQKKEQAAQPQAGQVESSRETIKQDYNKAEGVAVTVTPGSTARRDVEARSAKSRQTAGSGMGSLARAPADKDESSAAETRSVAGRRFRKSGSVWIDTGYDASKPITSVARGSEQYRALVADEPSIRTIAEQLDGEIVVVWKSRTYRIR